MLTSSRDEICIQRLSLACNHCAGGLLRCSVKVRTRFPIAESLFKYLFVYLAAPCLS